LEKDITVEDLTTALAGEIRHKPKQKHGKRTHTTNRKLDFIIDIQAKIAQGKGVGYERWAKVFNLKQMSEVLFFMQEHGVESIDELNAKADAASNRFDTLQKSIKTYEKRLGEIAVLRKHIINYAKTREIYVAYRKARCNRVFFEAHREEITLHKAAKGAFNDLGMKKIPRVNDLNAEYSEVLARKKAAYAGYRKAKTEM